MLLNVGCGNHYAPGWTNLDITRNQACRPDILGDVRQLPFPDSTVQRAYLGHVLEHIPWEDVHGALQEVHRVLEPGASVLIVGPAIENATDPHVREGIVHGAGRWAGDRHMWVPSAASTLAHTQLVFPAARPLALERIRLDLWPVVALVPWQCAVSATKRNGGGCACARVPAG